MHSGKPGGLVSGTEKGFVKVIMGGKNVLLLGCVVAFGEGHSGGASHGHYPGKLIKMSFVHNYGTVNA